MRKSKNKILSIVLAVIMMLSVIPISAMAAPASDLPKSMLDHSILRALAYTGYNVEAQKADGTLYQTSSISSRTPASVLSGISYGTSTSGFETVSNSGTKTGLAPNIAKFKQSGLCCASFVTYYICNYLPNIEGVDTKFISDAIKATGMNSQAVVTWEKALGQLAAAGKLEKIGTSSSNVDRSKLSPGDIIIFGNGSNTSVHAAIFSGTYKGEDYIIHVGNDRGPEISLSRYMAQSGNKASTPNAYYHLPQDIFSQNGRIEVNKRTPDGNKLAGAYFTATSTTDSSKQYKIGPTNNSGYAFVENVPYGTYRIVETVFPTNYRGYGQTEWTVTLNQNSPNGTVKIDAVNELIPGKIKIVKTSEDGKVDGITFIIKGNGVNKTVKTGSNGEINSDELKPGTYTVTEQIYDKYEPQETRSVTVVSGKTATVTFNNTLKRGILKVTKTSEDKLVEGVKFKLSGTSLSGHKVEQYAVTNANGIAIFNDVLITGNTPYVLEEVETEEKYVVPNAQEVMIEWNKVTEKSLTNILKKFRVTAYKTDKELSGLSIMSYSASNSLPYGETQGNATLKGAVYGIYKNGFLLNKFTTDENGYFITDYYVCGDGYYLQEISPSEGYLVDDTKYYIDCTADRYTVELNTEYLDMYEQIIKGKIGLVKHTDNGDTQIETPETGAAFEIYLKQSGSYEKAKITERDMLIIDKDGFAMSKELPYGIYTVHQTKGREGRELLPDFDVAITQDGFVYRYIINNANFESYIKITKTDATTGKVIPYAGAGFKLYAPDGTQITMKYTYPTVTVIDTFYTTADGTFITPETLPYGKGYSLVEVQANYGYVLDSTPVYFDISEENSTTESNITVVNVTKGNQPQMGKITITKSGEVFYSVTEKDGMYKPNFKIAGLEGAVFSVYADEDVYTPDGTLRYEKGQKADTVTTGKDGKAVTKELYLGKYVIKEDNAPYGMVLNGESVYAELTYAGQEIGITATSASMSNQRQKIVLDLLKAMEKDDTFKIGANGEILNVSFGLYANDTLTASDGKTIPKDGLIEVVKCSTDGKAVFTADIPVDSRLYVKEISTDNSYVLSDSKYPVEFAYAGDKVATVYLTVNNGESIENKLIRGNIEGYKTDEDGNAVEGAEFGLFSADATEFTKENAIIIATSDEDGKFHFDNIPYGKWLIKELYCPEYYVLSDEIFTAEIKADGDLIKIEAVNEFVTGSIKITKTDKYTGNNLSGAVFEVYRDVNDNKVFDADIDILCGTLLESETEKGLYSLGELRYGGYFLHEAESPEYYLVNDRYHYFTISENGKTVTVETDVGKGFENIPYKGDIKIIKKDADTGEALEGVEFGLFDLEGNEIARGKTNENGELLFDDIHYGKYQIRELTAKDGYQKNDEITEVDITEDGQMLTFELTNKKIPEQPHSPQTGDNSNIGLWLTLLLLSSLCMIWVFVFKRRAQKY